MGIIKIAVTADIHLSAKNLNEKTRKWNHVVERIADEDATHIIIIGDTLDHFNILGCKNGAVGDVYAAFLEPIMREESIGNVDIIDGNHDQAYGEGRAGTYPLMRDNIEIFNRPYSRTWPGTGMTFHYLPWMAKEKDNVESFLKNLSGGILFGHLEVSGAKMHEGFLKVGGDFALNQTELAAIHCQRIYLGHVHIRQSFAGGKIQYIGHPFQNSFKDAGNPQGFLLLTLHDNGTFEERYVDIDFPCYYTFTGEEYVAAKQKGLLKDTDIIKIRDTQIPTLAGEMLPIELPSNVRFEAVPIEAQVQLRTDMSISDSPLVLLDKWAEVNGIEYEKDAVGNLLSDTLRQIQFEDPALGSLVRVVSLAIEGMGSYRDNVMIDWPDGIIGIMGGNGQGKSTLLEGAFAALYGNFPSKSSIFNQVNTKKTEGYLGLRFITGETEYLAERFVTRENQKVCLSRILEDGKKKVIANKVREFKAEISKLVGDEKLFLASCMASQNRVNSFLLAERTERKEMLSKLLGFQNLTAIKKQLSEDYDKKFADLRGYRRQFEEITFENPAAIEQDLAIEKKTMANLEARRVEIEASNQQLIEEKARLQAEIEKNESNRALAASIESRIAKLERSIGEHTDAIEACDDKITEYMMEIEKYEHLLEQLQQKMTLVEEDIKDEAAELKAASIEVLEQRDGLTQKAEEKVAAEKYELRINATIRELQARIDNRDNERRLKRQSLTESLEQLRKKTALLSEIGCAANPLDCKLIKATVEEKARIPVFEEELEALELEIMEGEYNEDDRLSMKEAEIERVEITVTISKLEDELTFFNQLDSEVNSKQQRINLLESRLHHDKVLGPIQQEIRDSEKRRMQAEQDVKDIEGKKAYYVASIDAAKNELPVAKKSLANLIILSTDEIQRELGAADEKQKKLSATLQSIATEKSDIATKIGRLGKDLQYNQEKQSEKQDYAEKIEVLAAEEKHYAVLIKAFDKNGIPQLLIDSCIPQIRLIMRDLLADFEDAFTIRLETQRITEAGDKVQEVLDIIVSDSEGERDIRDYSGGEKGIIDLVFRIAFARLQAQRTGAKIQIFAADEPFDALDSENSQRVLMVLQKMIDAGINQVFIISHSDEIVQNLPILYRATKENGTTGIERLW